MSETHIISVTRSQNPEETSPIAARLVGRNGEASGLSEPQQKRLLESRSGGKTPASTTTTPKKRKAKSQTGIWMIEKSLDKKNWIVVREIVVRTRADGQRYLKECSDNLHGIHYRLARYEPAR